MKMENLTDKQKESIKDCYSLLTGGCYNKVAQKLKQNFSKVFTEPHILNVRIESDGSKGRFQVCDVANAMEAKYAESYNLKITALPALSELYTAEDMIEFATDYMNELDICDSETYLSDWKKSKETKKL